MKYETDSRKIKPGQIFVAIKGHTVDGHDFIQDAIKNGASKVIAEHEVDCNIPLEVVPNTEEYLKEQLKNEYADEINKLKIIGLTGTNGKTTTAYLTYQLLNLFKEKTAYIGTIGFKAPNDEIETENTTPDTLTIYSLLLHALEIGCKTVVMEVSSHALSFERIYGLHIDIAAFTNLTEDHLDYHKTMENYLNAKLKIFDYMNESGKLIVNNDDNASKAFVNKFGSGIKLGYNNTENDYNILKTEINPAETKIKFTYKNETYNVTTNLTSKFNVYNYMTSLAILHECGYKIEDIIDKTKEIKAPKGRCETHKVNGGYAVIDYAHTPDAVEKVITAYNELKKGKLVIRKLDSSNGNVISNVEFVIMKDNEVIYEGVTNEYGEIEINNLPLGIYIIKEVRASNGYILNEDEIEVSLDSEVKYIEIFNIPDTEVRIVDIIMFFEEKKKLLV